MIIPKSAEKSIDEIFKNHGRKYEIAVPNFQNPRACAHLLMAGNLV
jgi:hypothetical protein